jgi:AbrB family looped-hinge helix DNA binding protein
LNATVAERGQVTIPKALRERLGIVPHTVLDFHEENGKLVAEKVDRLDPVGKVLGCLKLGRPVDDVVAELRGE